MNRAAWLAALAAVIAIGCSDDAPPPSADRGAPGADKTRPATPSPASAPAYVGVVFARNRSDISAAIGGKLVDVLVRAGDPIEAGEAIARVDPRDVKEDLAVARADLASARASRDSARAALREAQDKLARTRQVMNGASGAISSQDVATARYAVERAQAAYQRADADVEGKTRRVDQFVTQRGKTEIVAPFSGTVAVRYLDPGVMITAGQPIVRLIDSHDPWVRFAVPPDGAEGLSVGDEVSVTIDGHPEPLAATIRQIAPEVDPVAHMVLVEAVLDPAAGDIRSGVAARVQPTGP